MADSSSRSPTSSACGGFASDILLWRRRNVSLSVLVGSTASWIIFDRAGYSFLSLLANALLLLVLILFFWARSASLLNRPLPPLPNLHLSDHLLHHLACRVQAWADLALAVARGIALRRDRRLFLEVILCLWAVSYVGSLFNFLTLVYIGVLLSLTGPVLYNNHRDRVDDKLRFVHAFVLNHCPTILKYTGKEHKTE